MGEESKSKSRSEEESTCCCVEGMADRLRKFEGFFTQVFEESEGGLTFAVGTIRDVLEDGQILHMELASKTVIFASGSGLSFFVEDLYISICEITEFAPMFPVTPATVAQIDAIKDQVLKNTNVTRVI